MRRIINLLLSSIVFILLISGCASTTGPTTKGYKQVLNCWIGVSEAQLVRKWGVPAQVFNSAGTRYFVYNSSSNVYIPGTSPFYTTNFIGGTAYTTSYGGSAPQNVNYNCRTTFEIIDGKVVSWRYKGNNCKATENKETKTKLDTTKVSYDTTPRKYETTPKQYYANLNLNTKEKKKWFNDLSDKLASGRITKSTFIKEGLKRYPTRKKEFTFFASHIL